MVVSVLEDWANEVTVLSSRVAIDTVTVDGVPCATGVVNRARNVYEVTGARPTTVHTVPVGMVQRHGVDSVCTVLPTRI